MRTGFNSTAGEIAEFCGGTLISGAPDTPIATITSDSRELGRDNLFIPIRGEKFDGHDYILPLLQERRISAFLTMDRSRLDPASDSGAAAIMCDDTLAALGSIARAHRKRINPRVIGITGTNGKTTTKELVYAVLRSRFSVLKNEKNYNNEIGVPFTLLGLEGHHDTAVIEMGMNHTGEIYRLSGISLPDIALITSVGEGHLEYLSSVENVALAKGEIMDGMKAGSTVILNSDTECIDLLMNMAADRGLVVRTFGMDKSADIMPESYRLGENYLQVIYRGEPVTVPLYGIHNVYNVLAAIAVAAELGIGPAETGKALSDFSMVGGRSSVLRKGFIVIDDTYNSNPLSSRYAIESVREVFPRRRKIAVLSDMKELGGSSARLHSEIGSLVARSGFDRLLVWGEMSGEYRRGAIKSSMKEENVQCFADKQELTGCLKNMIDENDVVLVKGSRSMKMEEVVRALTG